MCAANTVIALVSLAAVTIRTLANIAMRGQTALPSTAARLQVRMNTDVAEHSREHYLSETIDGIIDAPLRCCGGVHDCSVD